MEGKEGGPPTFWVGLGMTLNVGNFESQKIDFGMANIPVNASKEYLDNLLDEARPKIEIILMGLATQMTAKAQEIKG